jgi:hypothetical protein
MSARSSSTRELSDDTRDTVLVSDLGVTLSELVSCTGEESSMTGPNGGVDGCADSCGSTSMSATGWPVDADEVV